MKLHQVTVLAADVPRELARDRPVFRRERTIDCDGMPVQAHVYLGAVETLECLLIAAGMDGQYEVTEATPRVDLS